jgi:uncharacterized protein (DUF697 family)
VGAISHSLKFANLWRVIRETDLQAVRQEGLGPFDLLIAGDPETLAHELRLALTRGTPHPWVRAASIGDDASGIVPAAVIVVTSVRPDAPETDAAARKFTSAGVPTIVVHAVPGAAPEGLSIPGHVRVGAFDEAGLDVLAATLLKAVPVDLRLPLARQLPAVRGRYFDILIDETARANATYSLTTGVAEIVPVLNVPLNLGDMIVLTKNQLMMAYRLVLASGRDGDPRDLVAELLALLGGGFLFRQLARQLVGMIPIVGIVPKVAIAYGGTWAIGRAVVLWLTEGRAVTSDLVRSLANEGLVRGRAIARELMDRAKTRSGNSTGRWARLRSQLPGLSSRRQPPP